MQSLPTITPSMSTSTFLRLFASLLLLTLGLNICEANPGAGHRSQGLQVLDIGERTVNEGPALAVVFSEVLDGKRRYGEFLEVQNRRNGRVAGSWQLSNNRRVLYFTPVEPETKYSVFVNPGLPAANGERLASAHNKTLTTRKISPGASFASQGLILPRTLSRGLPVNSVNVAEIDLDFWHIDADKTAAYLYRQNLKGQVGQYSLSQLKNYGKRVFSGRWQLNLKHNHRTTTLIPVQDIDALHEPGIYVAVIKPVDDYPYEFASSSFFISDMALIARQYKSGIEVFVHSIADNQALQQVSVSLLDRKGRLLDAADSNARGELRLRKHKNARFLLAQRGNDVSVLPLRSAALDLSQFRIDGPAYQATELFAWGPRDLYRPGEQVPVSILMRDADGQSLPNRQLFTRLKRPDGRMLGSQTLRSEGSAGGYFQQSIALDRDAPTGEWTLQLRADPAQKSALAEYRFRVEEFLPERMRLQLSPQQATLTGNDPLKIDVEGAWLYGAPASKNRLDSELLISPAHQPFTETAWLKDYWFGDIDAMRSIERRQLPSIKLDNEGHTHIDTPTVQKPAKSPLRIGLIAHLFEPGGRKITRASSQILWPASAMVGIKPLKTSERFDPDTSAAFEIARVNTAGEPLPASNLQVKVIREERDYYWEHSDDEGWHYRYSESKYPILQTVIDRESAKPARLEVPVEWGSYILEILDPQTRLTTRYRFHAGWSWADNNDDPAASRPDAVNLGWDKAAYQAGDIATLSLNSPHAGRALVLVESDKLLWQTSIEVEAGKSTVQIPVSADWRRHDIYATAIVLRRPADTNKAVAAERITPKRAMGVIHLPLNREARRLMVDIEAPQSTHPDQRQGIRLRVRGTHPGFQPQRVKVSLAAVDLGVLNITRFQTPDPWAHFFSRRRLGIDSRDSYRRIIENLDGKTGKLRFGGDMALKGSKRPDAKVQIVSLYQGLVPLDANGEAQVDLDLPSFNGKLRLMAVAWDDSSYGHGEREMAVAAPIVAEAGLPRFLAPGDQSMLTLDLFNRSDSAQALTVKLQLSGPLARNNDQQGQQQLWKLPLERGQRHTLRIPLLAKAGFGIGKLDLQVDIDGYRIRRHYELPVQSAWPDHHGRQRWRLQAGQSLNIGARELNGLLAPSVQAQLSVSSRPPLNPAAALHSLLQYPYGCVEQTTSRAWPLLDANEATAKRLGIKPLGEKRRNKAIRAAIKRVQGMQVSSGGFGLWNANSPEEPWLTPWVADFLVSAREHGYPVPESMMKPLFARLGDMLRSGGGLLRGYSEAPKHLRLAARAYAGYVLSRINKAPLSALRTLWDRHHADAKSPLPLLHLGLALGNLGDQRRASAALKAAQSQTREPGYLGDYGSEVRDLALLVAHLEQRQANSSGQLLFKLANAMQNRSYLSTQDQAALFLLALQLSAQRSGQAGNPDSAWSAMFTIGDQQQSLKQQGQWRKHLNAEDIRRGIELRNHGDQDLYASFEINAAPLKAPAEQQDPVQIRRRWYDRNGKPIPEGRALSVGELIIVELEVHSALRLRHGLVIDRLPAGLEPENLNLLQGDALTGLKVNGLPLSDSRFRNTLQHQEYRDDRYVAALWLEKDQTRHLVYLMRAVTPGSYVIPPPRLEDMYRPAIRATGKGGQQLEVRP